MSRTLRRLATVTVAARYRSAVSGLWLLKRI